MLSYHPCDMVFLWIVTPAPRSRESWKSLCRLFIVIISVYSFCFTSGLMVRSPWGRKTLTIASFCPLPPLSDFGTSCMCVCFFSLTYCYCGASDLHLSSFSRMLLYGGFISDLILWLGLHEAAIRLCSLSFSSCPLSFLFCFIFFL